MRSLKKLLASSTDTPVESQILLNKQGVKLEDDALISSYEVCNPIILLIVSIATKYLFIQ